MVGVGDGWVVGSRGGRGKGVMGSTSRSTQMKSTQTKPT